ncbi:S1 RNA-binding domain-containing protein [Streptomyces sp. NPDC001073]
MPGCRCGQLRFADQTGHILDGTVTKIIPFGVFVRLAPGIEGLPHVSLMTDSPVESPVHVRQSVTPWLGFGAARAALTQAINQLRISLRQRAARDVDDEGKDDLN